MSKLSECLPLQETTNIRPLVWLLAVLCDKCSSRDLVYFHRIAQCDLLPVPVAIPLSVSLSFCSGRCFSVPVHVAVFPSLSLSLCPFPCPRLSVPVPVFSAPVSSPCSRHFVPLSLSLSLYPCPCWTGTRTGMGKERRELQSISLPNTNAVQNVAVLMVILLYIHAKWRINLCPCKRCTNPSTLQQEILYGAKLRLFCIKLQDTWTTKIFFCAIFLRRQIKFDSSTRSTEQFEIESKRDRWPCTKSPEKRLDPVTPQTIEPPQR